YDRATAELIGAGLKNKGISPLYGVGLLPMTSGSSSFLTVSVFMPAVATVLMQGRRAAELLNLCFIKMLCIVELA
ncbi:hypothetical protein Ancab_036003, partial [Ancistrocladus abbreviatus]